MRNAGLLKLAELMTMWPDEQIESSCNTSSPFYRSLPKQVGTPMKTDGDFAHRENSDGTFDSICLHCYLTVGTATAIQALVQSEKSHICNGDIKSVVNDSSVHSGRLELVSKADHDHA
jgi:hypothetical protein